jgi:translation initiation factor IF-2
VAKKVKIYEIAKAIGISSGELLEICQKIGYEHITHHSKGVEPADADEIRRKAILRYRPKVEAKPAAKAARAKPKKKAPAKPKVKKRLISTKDVKPVPPPKPMGQRRAAATVEVEAEPEETPAPAPAKPAGRRRRREPQRDADEHITKRTIVFKQPKRRIQQKERPDKIELETPVTVRELCDKMGVPANEIIKELMFEHGLRATITATIEDETVQLIGMSHDVEIVLREPRTAEDVLLDSLPEDDPADLVPRPPVIALLGHVDHGKTSILDHIRHTHVAEGESGGITQHIAAWQVQADGHTLTFVDTPGHEAFTALRARGARVTDIVVLVVAADDGVMPQTVEAINHARAADVPIVVAINKMDKPNANAMRVLQQLAGHELNPEPWGGDVGCVELSAVTGQGITELLERIILEAELLDIRANPNRSATGAVVESKIEPGRGPITQVVVQTGTLRRGDVMVCGNAYGFVRAIYDDAGREIERALPSQPVAVSGLNRVLEAGDAFVIVDSLDKARKVAYERDRQVQRRKLRPRHHVTLENLYESLQSGQTRQLNVVLKADVQGSLEPLLVSLDSLGDEEVSVKVIHSGVGQVNTSDILLADASDAVVVAFRTEADEKTRALAAERGIEILHYDVIYHLTEEIRNSLEGLLAPEQKEETVGHAIVRQVFRISRFGTIAGCFVEEGAIRRNCQVRVTRDGETLHEGVMASLRQEKTDVREVENGRECGINIEGFNDIQPGDTIECFTTVTVRRTLA